MNFERTRKGMCCFSLLSASKLLKLLDGYDTSLKYGHQQGWTTVLITYKSLSPLFHKLVCSTGVIFSRFPDERKQARSGRGAQDTCESCVPHPLCFA